MNKLILALATITITASVSALNDSTNIIVNTQEMIFNNPQNDQTSPDNNHPDGVMMQDGKMVQVKNGKTTDLDRDLTMRNGTRIMRDGTFTTKDGKKTKIKEGQHFDMSGNMTSTETNKDRDMKRDRNKTTGSDSTKNNRRN